MAYETFEKTFKLYFEHQDKFYESILLAQKYKKDYEKLEDDMRKKINILTYELEKKEGAIYLMENYSKEQVNEILKNINVCIICKERERNIVFIPCDHLACCEPCAVEIISKCPICRQNITNKIKVYNV